MKRDFIMICLLALPVLPAAAGTITMQVSCAVQGSNLVVQVENKGDEAARNVSARIVFNGGELETPPLDALPPNQPRGVPLALPVANLRGTYPAVVSVNFEDANGYQFSTVSVVQVPAADARRSDIIGVLDAKQLRGKTKVPLRIRSEAAEAVNVRYKLVLPRELTADETSGEVLVPAGGTVVVGLNLENFSALPNSRYGLHVVLEYDADGRHNVTVASGSVQVVPPRGGLSPIFIAVAAIVAMAILISFIPRRQRSP